jgi:hypothetical protein
MVLCSSFLMVHWRVGGPEALKRAIVLAAVKDASRRCRGGGPEDGPSLTAAARDRTGSVQVGTEGWSPRSNKRMGLPGSASRAPYRFREVELCPSVSEVRVLPVVTIQISFCSVFHRPSFCLLFELLWRK